MPRVFLSFLPPPSFLFHNSSACAMLLSAATARQVLLFLEHMWMHNVLQPLCLHICSSLEV
jgi:hypothetical protein